LFVLMLCSSVAKSLISSNKEKFCEDYCSVITRVVVSVSNVSVSKRSRGVFLNVSVSSRYRHSKVSVSSRSRCSNVSVSSRSGDSNVSVSSQSRLLTSRLHRTSKFKLRTITIKFSILYRDTWTA